MPQIAHSENSEIGSVAKRLNNASGHRICLCILLSLYLGVTTGGFMNFKEAKLFAAVRENNVK